MAVLPTANRGLAVQMVVLFLAATGVHELGRRDAQRDPGDGRVCSVVRSARSVPSWPGGLVAAGLLAAGRTTSAPSGRTALLLGLAAAVVPVGLLASRWWRSAP